jgi:hypothetical protein
MTTRDTIVNFFLKMRYALRNVIGNNSLATDFGIPSFVSDFNTDGFNISNNDVYNNIMVTSKNNVIVKDGVLHLLAKPTEDGKWTIGWIDYDGELNETWGTWEAKMKLPSDSWCAFWFLREWHWDATTLRKYNVSHVEGNKIFIKDEQFEAINYNWFVLVNREPIGRIDDFNVKEMSITLNVPITIPIEGEIEIGPDHIITEVDVMEPMKKNGEGKTIIKHTLHYKPMLTEYKGKQGGPWVTPADEEWHSYAVTMYKDGYKFYIDNILTGVFTDPLSIVPYKAYPILNVAVHPNRKQEELTMLVEYLKYYK